MLTLPYGLARPFLFGLDPEQAHELTLGSIAKLQNTPAMCLWQQPRVADPGPGQVLPTPSYFTSVVQDIANRFPNDLRNSCVEHGGNNRWLFRLVSELRTRDKRWGLNWKRANVGDMSQDIVTYNWSSDPDEGTFNTRVYDVIGGHCGSNPSWNNAEVTVIGSRGSIWTLLPYIQAGNIP